MALQIDRVNAQMQVLRKPDNDTSPAQALAGMSREEHARMLRPIVIDIIGDHLRDLERRGVV